MYNTVTKIENVFQWPTWKSIGYDIVEFDIDKKYWLKDVAPVCVKYSKRLSTVTFLYNKVSFTADGDRMPLQYST